MKGNILLVDDSALMRKILLRSLKTVGVEFEQAMEAGDGLEALAFLRKHKFELITCDINMPNMGGLELLAEIKRDNLAPGVPIVMVTTEGSEAFVRQAVLVGARGYVRKPFIAEHIANRVLPLLNMDSEAA
jgi:two-component system chemotaxis response regulator CheY